MTTSARATALGESGPLLVAMAGAGLLAFRVPFVGLPSGSRVAAAVVVFCAIGAASLCVPGLSGARRLPQVVVLAAGLVAIALASATVGRPSAFPMGAWTVPLIVLAVPAEELLFRRLMYGLLARRSETMAVAVTAVAFALVHLPLYGVAALPVNLGAGLLLSWQRWATGSWTVPAATHAAANLVAVIR